VFAAQHPLRLGLADLLFQLRELFFDLSRGLGVSRLCELEKDVSVL
jgi:hypothetical protein